VAELRADAAALPRVWRALGAAPPPLTIVVLPYLYEPVWSGDLLLLPEVGFPIAQATREHAAAATLAQLWLRSARPEHLAACRRERFSPRSAIIPLKSSPLGAHFRPKGSGSPHFRG
jgi:hypothetical protein